MSSLNNYCYLTGENNCPTVFIFKDGCVTNCCEVCYQWSTVVDGVSLSVRDQMVEHLKGGVCSIFFTKADGSERKMRATLNIDYLPKEDSEHLPNNIRKFSIETIRCFDTDIGEWRSFRVDSVMEFAIL